VPTGMGSNWFAEKNILFSVLVSTSTTVSACSFENKTQPLPILAFSCLLVGFSILLFFYNGANKNVTALFIATVLTVPTIILVVLSWESVSPCSTLLQMLAPLVLVASALIFFSSLFFAIWVKIKK